MATIIDIDEVQRMVQDGAQLVDVLPEREYGEEHLRGAISLPLKSLNPETACRLDSSRPVILYCSSRT